MKKLPNSQNINLFLTVEEAAAKLKVSAQTLRRWDERGILVPQRTGGNQRRYTLDQLFEFKKNKKNRTIAPVSLSETPQVQETLPVEASLPEVTASPVIDIPVSSVPVFNFEEQASMQDEIPVQMFADSVDIASEESIKDSENDSLMSSKFPVIATTPEDIASPTVSKQTATFLTQLPVRRLVSYGILGISGIFLLGLALMLVLPNQIKGLSIGQGSLAAANAVQTKITSAPAVLAGATAQPNLLFSVNVPSLFKKQSEFQDTVKIDKTLNVTGLSTLNGGILTNDADINAGTGNLTAANVIYGIKAGQNVTVSAGQTPTISVNVPAGTTLQGQSGNLTLSAGSGIGIDGLTISNTDTGSSQNIFKNILVSGQSTVTASQNNDSLEFVAGTGIVLTTNAGSKQITIGTGGSSLSQWTTNGTSIYYNTGNVGIGTSTPSSPLDVAGDIHLTGSLLIGSDSVNNLSGQGLAVSGGTLGVDLASSAIGSSTTSSFSGLEFVGGNQLSLIQGCSNGQVLNWNATAKQWQCAQNISAAVVNVNWGPNNFQNVSTLAFDQNDFIASQSGQQVYISTNYVGGHIAQTNMPETITGNWNFANGLTGTNINLTNNTNQITLGTGNTGTISLATLTGNRTYTFPDQSGTVCLTSGNCTGTGAGIGGGGTTNYIPKFSSSFNIADSLLYDAGTGVGVGTTVPIGFFSVNGGTSGGNAAFVVNQTGAVNNDIFTASASGTTKFTIANNGNLTATGTLAGLTGLSSSGTIAFSGLGTGVVQSTGGTLSVGAVTNAELQNSSITINNGAGISGGGLVSLGGSLTLTNSGVTSALAGTGIGLSGATGAVTISNTGVTSITGTANQVTASSSTGGVTLSLPQDIAAASNPTFAGLTLSGFIGNNAVVYGTSGTGVLTTASTNTVGQCLVSGGSAPVWTTCAGATGLTNSPFNDTTTAGTITQNNPTEDLLLGGTSTASAKFAFINTIGAGTPTASISGTGNKAIYIAANGTLATTNAQSLNLGAAGTGNIALGNGQFTTNGGLVYTNAAGVLNQTGAGTSTTVLHGGAVPTYGAVNLTTDVSNTLPVGNGGTGANNLTANGLLVGNGTSPVTSVNGTSGQIVIANGSSIPTFVTLSNDATISNTGALTLKNTGTAGTYGSASQVPVFTTDAQGRVTTVTNTAIAIAASQITSGQLAIAQGGTNTNTVGLAGSVAYSNGSAYAFSGVGSAGQILISGGAGAPTWVSAGSVGTNFFQLNSGAISPVTESNDLLLGSTATTSAKFAFVNVGSGTPTASISAQNAGGLALVLDANGNLQTTNKGSLTLGGGQTGNVVVAGIGTGVVQSTNGALSTGTVSNAELQNSSITINNGTGISGGGLVSLGGSLTITNAGVTSALAGTGIGVSGATGAVTFSNTGVLSIIGTANQVIASAGTGAITLSLPQDIAAGSAPTFASLNLTNNTNQLVLGTGSTGTISLAGLTGNRTYTFPDQSGTVCLSTSTGCIPGSTNFFQLSNGALSPIYSYPDLLLGSTATSSAKFAFINVGSGTPTASISAQNGSGQALALDASGNIQTANKETLTFGGSQTGDINFYNANNSINSNGVLSIASVFKTAASSNEFVVNSGSANTGIISFTPTAAETITIPDSPTGDTVCLMNLGNCVGTGGGITGSGTATQIAFFTAAGAIASDSNLYFDNVNKALGVGTSAPIGKLNVVGGPAGKALVALNYTGSGQNIFTASASGTTEFNVAANGNIGFAGNSSFINTLTTAPSTSANTYTFPDATGTICLSTGNCIGGGGGGSVGGSGTNNFIAKFTPDGSHIGNSLLFDNGLGLAIGSTTPIGELTVNGNNVANAAAVINQSGSADIFTASSSGTAKFTIGNDGTITSGKYTTGIAQFNGAGTLSSSAINLGTIGSSYITGTLNVANGGTGSNNLTANGLLLGNGTSAVTSVNGTSGQILVANVSNVPTFVTLSSDATISNTGALTLKNTGTAGTYGSASQVPVFTTDAQGRVTTVTNTSIAIAASQITSGQLAIAQGGTNTNTVGLAGSIAYSTGTAYAFSAVGSGGQCLVSGGTGTPTWGACGSSSPFQSVGGTVQEINNTQDLLLGGAATSSAKFAFINVNTGTPTASISAQNAGGLALVLDANGNLQTTNKGSLTLGGGQTGNVVVSGIGTGVVQANAGVLSTGAVTNAELQNSLINLAGDSGTGTVSLGGTYTVHGTTAQGITTSQSGSTLTITAANADISGNKGVATFNSTNFTASSGTINTAQPINMAATPTFAGLTLSGFTGNNAVVFGTAGSGLLTTASTNTVGQCLVSGGSNPIWTSCSGATGLTNSPFNDTTTAGTITQNNLTEDLLLGGVSTPSAKFAVLHINNGTPTATLSAGTNSGLAFDAAGNIQTFAGQTLTLGGPKTGNIALGNGQFTTNGGLLFTNTSGVVSQTGAGTSTTVLHGGANPSYGAVNLTTDVSNTLPVGNGGTGQVSFTTDGVIYGNNTSGLGVTSAGTNGQLFLGVTSGAPQFGTLSGDATITNTGVLTLKNTGTAGTYGSASQVPVFTTDAQGRVTTVTNTSIAIAASQITSGQLAIANGGTNASSIGLAGSIAYSTGTAYAFSAVGSTGQCFVSGGTGTPTWGACGSSSPFQSVGGMIQELNNTQDLLLGGTATNSAKFAFTNVNNNTPTASLSAQTGNTGLAIDASGNVQTYDNQSLTLGGSKTGNVIINSGGNIALTAQGANLTAGGTFTLPNSNTLTGVTNYTQFSNGVSVGGGTALHIDSTGNAVLATGTFNAGTNQLILGSGNTATLNATGLTAPRTYAFPDASGTLCLQGSTSCGFATGVNSPFQSVGGTIQALNNTQDILFGGTSTAAAKFAFNNTNGDLIQTSSDTIGNALTLNGNSITTGNVATISANALTTGTGLSVYSSSTALTAGGALGSYYWNPAGGTVSTGDLLDLNVGAGGTLANIFNVMDNGSSDFAVSQSQITANLPTQFTAPGDTSFAYDIDLTNPVSSFIKSASNLSIQAGDTFGSSNLTLGTFNLGNVIIDSQALVANNAATVAGQLVVGTSTAPSMGEAYITNSSTFGQALLELNQTESQDIFAASASGTTKFVVNNTGNLQFTGNTSFLNTLTSAATAARTYTLPDASGTICLQGSVSCGFATGTSSPFQSVAGTIQENNLTQDLLLGGTATSTAKFAFLNVAGGTPTASIAGTTNSNALALTGNGSIQTQNANTLTLGGNTTGNVVINSAGNIALTAQGSNLIGNGTLTGLTGLASSGNVTLTGIGTGNQSSVLFLNSSNQLALTTTTSGTQQCLLSSGASTGSPVWGACGAAGPNSPFQSVAGTIQQVNNTQDVLFGGTSTASAKFAFNNTTGDLIQTSSDTTGNALTLNGNSITTGNVATISANALTTGTGLSVYSSSTNLTAGGALGSYYWNPAGGTVSTGDLLDLNVGSGGTLANIFNVMDNGSSDFAVSQSQITANLPTQFTAPGDTSFAYDIDLTNPIQSNINSASALNIYAGDPFASSNLTIGTYNVGNVIADSQAFVTTGSASVSGQLVVGTSVAPANIGGLYVTNASTFGKALAILNQTENTDILTGSASGTTKFVVNNTGNLQFTGNTSFLNTLTSAATAARTYTLPDASGTICLQGSVSCGFATGTSSPFQSVAGTIQENNLTQDLLLGGNSTASAKFAFINTIGAGTPTASISGASNNAISITATGNIGTTNGQTLTLGTAGTGNVALAPGGTPALLALANGNITETGGNFTQIQNATPTIVGHTAADATNMHAPYSIAIVGKYAYVVDLTGNMLTVVDISNPTAPVEVGHTAADATNMHEPEGVAVAGKYAYVTDALGNMLTVVDISNPTAPYIVGEVSDGTNLNAPQAVAISGKYAYVTAGNGNMLTTVDISNPALPTVVGHTTADPTNMHGPVGVTIAGKYAYVAASTGNNITIVDISIPTAPIEVGNTTFDATNMHAPSYIALSGKYAYVTAYSGNMLTIVDISIPASPVEVGHTTADATNMNGPKGIVVSGKYAYVTDNGTTNMVTAVDVSNPASPFIAGHTAGDATNLNTPAGIALSGKYAYIAVQGSNMVTVIDVTGIDTPAANIGSILTDNLNVSQNENIAGGLNVVGAIQAGTGGLFSTGGLSVVGGAYIGGNAANAAEIINQTAGGGADIFTASVSGLTKFTLSSGGTITASNYGTGIAQFNSSGVLSSSAINLGTIGSSYITGQLGLGNGGTGANLTAAAGGIVYSGASALAISSVGSIGQCLVSGGTGAPTWGTCGSISPFQSVAGTIQEVNNTQDLLLGGTSTASAKFAFINVNSGTPTASISGASNNAISITATGNIGTTNGQTLTLGTLGTGNIALAPNGNTALTALKNGNIGIGTTNPTAPLFVNGGLTGGNAAAIFNQTNSNDLFAASASGTTKFVINNNGNLQLTGNTSFLNTLTSAATAARTYTLPDATGTICLQGSASCGFATGANSPFQSVGGTIQALNNTQDILFGGTSTAAAKFAFNMTNGDLIQTSSDTTGNALTLNGNSITTGNVATISANALTTGTGLSVYSSSTALTAGGALGSYYWNPAAGTTSTGDLLDLNVGSGGTLANIFNVMDNGSSDFSVSQSQITANLPVNFTSPGDVSLAYDLDFTNPTASYINSQAPLYIQAGQVTDSSDLNLSTYNQGNVLVNSQALVVNGAATVSGQLVLGTTVAPSMGEAYITNSSTFGQALLELNQTESQDIFTASSAGTTKFTIANNGTITASNYGAGVAQFSSAGVLSSSALNLSGSLVTSQLGVANGGTGLASVGAGGLLYGNGTSALGVLTTAGTGQCLLSNGSSAPSWGACTTASNSPFSVINGAITENNTTEDLLLGGVSTASAKFAFINVNGNTPTASLSAQTGNTGLAIDASGNIQTFDNQTLTLGGSNTGNVSLVSGGTTALTAFSSGNIGIGAGTPAVNLQVIGDFNAGAHSNNGVGFILNGINGHGAMEEIINTGQNSWGIGELQSLGSSLSFVSNYSTGGGGTSALTIAGNGNTGIGATATAPSSLLQVSGGTNGGNALVIFNQTGASTDDIVTASSSGITKFTIANNGNLQLTGNTSFLNTITSAATAARTYTLPDASGTICLQGSASCGFATGSSSPFQSVLGTIQELNNTQDLLLGGTATNTAKFAFINVNSGTPTASISANSGNNGLYITGDGTLATTNRGSLTLGNSSTYDTSGNVLINPNGDGFLGIGTNSPVAPADIAATSTLTSGIREALHIGSVLNPGGTTTASSYGIYSDASYTANQNSTSAQVVGGIFRAKNSGGNTLGNGYGAEGALVLSGNSTINSGYDLYAAQPNIAAGSIINNAVGLFVSNMFNTNGNTSTTGGYANYGAYITLGNQGGNTSGTDGNYGLRIVGNGGVAGAGGAVNNYGIFADTTAPSYFAGNLGLGTISPTTTLYVNGGLTGGNAAEIINQTNGNDLFTASSSGTTKFTIGNDGTITSGKYQTDQGVLFTNASGVVNQTANPSTSGLCLLSATSGGTPTWGTCPSGSSTASPFQSVAGTIQENNLTQDVLFGGNSTDSAKFGFLNMNSGTPTASISGTSNSNALSLSGNGAIQTQNGNTLTLGGSTTGNVVLAPNGNTALTAYMDGSVGLGLTGTTNGLLSFFSSNAGETAPTIGTDSSGNLNIAAPTGTVNIGSGTGNITLDPGTSSLLENLSSTGDLFIQKQGTTFADFTHLGQIGFNTTSPFGAFDVRGLNATTSTASISATSTFADLVLDQAGTGDIFTASKSGAMRFTIGNDGTITSGKYQTDQGLLFTSATGVVKQTAAPASSGLCLTSATSGGTPTWGACGTTSPIQSVAGTLQELNNTQDLLLGGTSTAAAKFAFNMSNGDLTQNSTDTTGNALTLNGNSITTGNVASISANALTTGFGLGVYSSSTNLTAGGALGSYYWNPAGGTVSTGDLLDLNVGAGGSLANIFNVMDNGSTDFSVSQTAVTSNLPFSETAPGDMSLAYNLNFTNPTASYLTSSAPLYIQPGEPFNSSDLILDPFNKGSVIADAESFVTTGAATVSGQLVLGTSTAPANIGGLYLTNSSTFGKALAILNQTENQDIFTASSSGTPVFKIDSNGNTRIGASLCVKATLSTACSGSTAGTIYATATTITSADVAENYVSGQALNPGDIVMMANDGNNQAVVKATSNATQVTLLGIVSTNPGVTINDDADTDSSHPNKYPIALSGRVPVRVSTVNGPIYAGDALTASDVPGVAVKAIVPGYVVGRALENDTDSNTSNIDTITAYASVTYFDPTQVATVAEPPASESALLALTGRVNTLETNVASLSAGTGSDNSDLITSLQNDNMGIHSQLDNLASQSAFLTSILESPLLNSLIASGSGEFANVGNMDLQNATVSGTLQVLGRTTLSDLGVTGNITAGLLNIDGLNGSINSDAQPLEIQSDGLANIELENKNVIIATNGDIRTNGTITAKQVNTDKLDITVDTTASPSAVLSTSAGTVTIPAGETSVTVQTNALTSKSLIFATPNTPVAIGTKKMNTNTIEIDLNAPAASDVKVNWWIVN